MNFSYGLNEDKEHIIYFCHRDMERHSTHLGIETYVRDEEDNEEYVEHSIEIYMSVEQAENFIKQFRESLDKYKKQIRYKETT